MKPRLILVWCLISGVVFAESVDERTWLAGERQAITQRFVQEEQACQQKFATTGCLADVRARRRDALAPLRERELNLADQERQHRAGERRRAVAAKQEAAAERPAEVPVPVLRLRQAPAPARLASAAPRTDDPAARDAEAAQRAQVHARRQADIDADKQRVADRVAARASQGKPVQPLPPLPPASAALASQPPR